MVFVPWLSCPVYIWIMVMECFDRMELLIGPTALRRLSQAHVLIVGVGGVGSWAAEILARSGIGHLTLVDFDSVKASNVNRQLHSLHSTIGKLKVSVMAERLLDINPQLDVEARPQHVTPEIIPSLLSERRWDYVVDAIDERIPKTALLAFCVQNSIPVISSMGAANRLSSQDITVVDIGDTSGCHLARLVRKALHRLGIERGINVVFSASPAIENAQDVSPDAPGERRPLGTIAYIPAIFGCKCAEKVIMDLLDRPTDEKF